MTPVEGPDKAASLSNGDGYVHEPASFGGKGGESSSDSADYLFGSHLLAGRQRRRRREETIGLHSMAHGQRPSNIEFFPAPNPNRTASCLVSLSWRNQLRPF